MGRCNRVQRDGVGQVPYEDTQGPADTAGDVSPASVRARGLRRGRGQPTGFQEEHDGPLPAGQGTGGWRKPASPEEGTGAIPACGVMVQVSPRWALRGRQIRRERVRGDRSRPRGRASHRAPAHRTLRTGSGGMRAWGRHIGSWASEVPGTLPGLREWRPPRCPQHPQARLTPESSLAFSFCGMSWGWERLASGQKRLKEHRVPGVEARGPEGGGRNSEAAQRWARVCFPGVLEWWYFLP